MSHLNPLIDPATSGSELNCGSFTKFAVNSGKLGKYNIVAVVSNFGGVHLGRTVKVRHFGFEDVIYSEVFAVAGNVHGPGVGRNGDQAAVGSGKGGVALIHDFIMAHFDGEVKGANRPKRYG